MVHLDPILLGDNPLFGINHLAQENARARNFTLKGISGVSEIVSFSSNLGIKGFVVSTHPALYDLIELWKNNTDIIDKINFYPIIPYAQKYVTMVTEKGITGSISEIMKKISLTDITQIMGRGALGLVTKDFKHLFKTFIDVELNPLRNVRNKVVFLHDVITDLALGLNSKEVIEIFIFHLKDKHQLQAGLVTKNFPLLVQKMREWDLQIQPIMTSFNKIGTQMNPTKEACEICIQENQLDVIAMNTLSGGYIKPKDAATYIKNLGKIKSVVIGASTKDHIAESFEYFRS